MEAPRLRVFENRVLREIFGSDREATGENCGKSAVTDVRVFRGRRDGRNMWNVRGRRGFGGET
jgi:hypothetical protein